jgi:hypothetical protein
MTSAEKEQLSKDIDDVFVRLSNLRDQGQYAVAHARAGDGKIFELRALSWILDRLVKSGMTIRFVNGPVLLFSAPRKFDPALPHFEVYSSSSAKPVAEVWTNMEVTGIGFRWVGGYANRRPLAPDYHELDIAVTLPIADSQEYIDYRSVLIAIECKDRELKKHMLRETLGLRRELSMCRSPEDDDFQIALAGLSPVDQQSPPSRIFLCSPHIVPSDFEKLSPIHSIHVERLQF